MNRNKIAREKRIVELMIGLYCRKCEKNSKLCENCQKLLAYAHARLEHCPFGEAKTSCKSCPVHCYQPAMREQMRRVMRFAGPRMLLYAPIATFRHWFGK